MNLLYTKTFEKFPQVGEKSSIEHKDDLIQKVSQLGKFSSHSTLYSRRVVYCRLISLLFLGDIIRL